MPDEVRELGNVRNRIARSRTRPDELLNTTYAADIIGYDCKQGLLAVSGDLTDRVNLQFSLRLKVTVARYLVAIES